MLVFLRVYDGNKKKNIKKNMNKNSVYVLRQPEHSLVTIIVVDTGDLPLDRRVHENIDALGEISDLVFVFSDHYSKTNGKVDIPKFSNLYKASAYLCGEGNAIGEPLFLALDYCKEVFQKHTTYLITDTRKLREFNDTGKIKRFPEIALMGIQKPLMRINRLGERELGEIYMVPETDCHWWEPKKPKETMDRYWSTHNSPTDIMFFKSPVIGLLVGNRDDEDFKDYIKTFTEDDFSYLMASLIVKKRIETTQTDIQNVELR